MVLKFTILINLTFNNHEEIVVAVMELEKWYTINEI